MPGLQGKEDREGEEEAGEAEVVEDLRQVDAVADVAGIDPGRHPLQDVAP